MQRVTPGSLLFGQLPVHARLPSRRGVHACWRLAKVDSCLTGPVLHAVGNIGFSVQNVLMACSHATTNSSQAYMAMLSANQTAPTG